MFENIIFASICWLCSFVFGLIALWAFKRTDPMHFWSGSKVRPEEIKDIPAYNRANGWMWTSYAAFMFVTGILSIFSIAIGTILLIILCIPGLVVLIIAYNKIHKKYRSTTVIHRTDNIKSKTPKEVIIALVSLSAIIIILMGVMYFYGEKDPEIIIYSNQIQIKSMYGLKIDFSEIEEISLLEKSMNDIGIGRRTNGYGGIGETLKGNFKSEALGETILFVQAKSSPTIRIKRIGKKDIYISLRHSEDTKKLYLKLK